jgi:hypothetical protein
MVLVNLIVYLGHRQHRIADCSLLSILRQRNFEVLCKSPRTVYLVTIARSAVKRERWCGAGLTVGALA